MMNRGDPYPQRRNTPPADSTPMFDIPMPRWDRQERRFLFEADYDGRRICCAVTPDILERMIGHRATTAKMLVSDFVKCRAALVDIAFAKRGVDTEVPDRIVVITAEDLLRSRVDGDAAP